MKRRPAPVVRRDLPTELPPWLADLEFVARLAGDRASAGYDAPFWTYVAGVAESLGVLAATPRFDRDQATTALRMVTALTAGLPVPLVRPGSTEPALLNLLPPVAPLGPGTPFAQAALGHAHPLVHALTRQTTTEQLTNVLTGARTLLRVYCLAAPTTATGVTRAAGVTSTTRARSGRGPPLLVRAIRRGCRLSPGTRENGGTRTG